MFKFRFVLALCVLFVSCADAQMADSVTSFEDDSLRLRYLHLSEELRCPKCQNQNLADSNAGIALDLRKELEKLLLEGLSDQQIVDHLVARYGDYVRYRPPVQANTMVLWLAPLILLLIGVLVVYLFSRRNSKAKPAENSPAETEKLALREQQLQRLLNTNKESEKSQ